MGNTNGTNQSQEEEQKLNKDKLSTVSLNGSQCKEKLNTSWKFSTLNDDDDDDDDVEKENLNKNENEKLLNNSITSDDDDNKIIKTKLNINSIIHIDDNGANVIDEYECQQENYDNLKKDSQNLSTSSATTTTSSSSSSTPPTSISSSPIVNKNKNEEEEEENIVNPNDTIENLAFNLLHKLTLANVCNEPPPATVSETTLTTTTETNQFITTLKVPEYEITNSSTISSIPIIPPPPCTPVSSVFIRNEVKDNNNIIFEKLLLSSSTDCSNANKPQLIIDDVLLMSREDGRPVVPLAEQEQSFNSIKNDNVDDDEEKKNLFIQVEEETKILIEHQEQHEKNSAFMMLINKIVPNSHMIEYNFEFEINENEADLIYDVKLTGSFNNWQQYLSMIRETKTKWVKNLILAPGDYEYKFVINENEWRMNSMLPNNGNNNILNLAKKN